MKLRTKALTLEISFPLAAAVTAVLIIDSSAAVCLLCAVIHECGHLAALYRFGAFPKRISLSLFDIAISDSRKPLRKMSEELTVILAGITANITAMILFICIRLYFPSDFADDMIYSNLILALFNGLPVCSLDGGQALYIILCRRLKLRYAEIAADIISFAVLLPLLATGFLLLIRTGYNFFLLLAAAYLMLLLILKKNDKFYL